MKAIVSRRRRARSDTPYQPGVFSALEEFGTTCTAIRIESGGDRGEFEYEEEAPRKLQIPSSREIPSSKFEDENEDEEEGQPHTTPSTPSTHYKRVLSW